MVAVMVMAVLGSPFSFSRTRSRPIAVNKRNHAVILGSVKGFGTNGPCSCRTGVMQFFMIRRLALTFLVMMHQGSGTCTKGGTLGQV